MNIEEERKAFTQYTALDSKVYNAEFAIWLKAKQHAADIAKPAVHIVYNIVKSAEQESFGDILFDGQFHKMSCIDWAHKNGYRVIE